jgi:hypothetical protein
MTPAATKDVLVTGFTANIITYRESLISTALCLKYSSQYRFDQLVEIATADFPGKENRFLLSYCFLNLNLNARL